MNAPIPSYWSWFRAGSGGKPGFRRIVNLGLLVHCVIGGGLAAAVDKPLCDAAKVALLPLISFLVGLTFAWSGNAQGLLQTREIEKLSSHHPGGYFEYIYIYQTAILTVLVTVIMWSIAALGVFDEQWPTSLAVFPYRAISAVLYLSVSLTVRQCWQVINGTHLLLSARLVIRKADETRTSPPTKDNE